MTDEQGKALARIAKAAVASEQATGVPAELTAAQAILESGWLSKAPGNNAFGVKAHSQSGRQLLTTHEFLTSDQAVAFVGRGDGRTAVLDPPAQTAMVGADGKARKRYRVQDWFAAYATLADGFADHARVLLQGAVYAEAWRAYEERPVLAELVHGIGAHYATEPGYAGRVLEIASGWKVAAAIVAERNGQQA